MSPASSTSQNTALVQSAATQSITTRNTAAATEEAADSAKSATATDHYSLKLGRPALPLSPAL